MLEDYHVKDIETFRFDETYNKYISIKLLNYWNILLKADARMQLPQECFCDESRRKEFKTLFYEFYDKKNELSNDI